MAGLSSYVNKASEPPPAVVNDHRQRIADAVRMPKPPTKLHHERSTSSAAPGNRGRFGRGLEPSKTPLEVKQEQPQSQQKHHSVFDTDVEDFDSTTTLAFDDHLKSSQPKTQSYEYAQHGIEHYNGNDSTGDDCQRALDDETQPQTTTDGAEQQYPEHGVILDDEDEEGEEERGEGEEDEDEEGGESGDESGSECESQDGNHTVDLTSMSVAARTLAANEDEVASFFHKIKTSGNRKTLLPLSPAPLENRRGLPVRNSGHEIHAVAESYRVDNPEDEYAETPSYNHENLAPPRAIPNATTTGKKTRQPTREKRAQPLVNNDRPSQQRRSWTGTTEHANQRSQPQMLQHGSNPSLALSTSVPKKVGGPTTVSQAQLEQPEDHTMSSIFDVSGLGENHYAISHPGELFANHATNPKEDFHRPALKRPFLLDYDKVQLSEMSFEELKNQPFDHDPRGVPSTLPLEVSNAPLADKLKYIFLALKTDTKKDEKRQQFFSSLTIDEHERCGDMIVDEFSNVIKKFKNARQEKRKLAMAYEEEVANREELVRTKRELLEKDMHRLKRAGEDVISGNQP